jgi:hypothetical protein
MTEPRTSDVLFEIALQHMPDIEPEIVPGTWRWNVVDGLTGSDNLGIELGVAGGGFSRRMMESGRFRRFWGVDAYSDHHDVGQYRQALQTVGLDRDYHLLRMTFAEAHLLFPDEFFDFVYVDGYAHSGEEGGRTILDWYAKVKPGGILAGDDYDPVRWPLVVWGVHHLVAQIGVPLRVTEHILEGTYNNYASWFIVKPTDPDAPIPQPDMVLQKLGQEERIAVAARKAAQRAAKRAARLKDNPPRES